MRSAVSCFVSEVSRDLRACSETRSRSHVYTVYSTHLLDLTRTSGFVQFLLAKKDVFDGKSSKKNLGYDVKGSSRGLIKC